MIGPSLSTLWLLERLRAHGRTSRPRHLLPARRYTMIALAPASELSKLLCESTFPVRVCAFSFLRGSIVAHFCFSMIFLPELITLQGTPSRQRQGRYPKWKFSCTFASRYHLARLAQEKKKNK